MMDWLYFVNASRGCCCERSVGCRATGGMPLDDTLKLRREADILGLYATLAARENAGCHRPTRYVRNGRGEDGYAFVLGATWRSNAVSCNINKHPLSFMLPARRLEPVALVSYWRLFRIPV